MVKIDGAYYNLAQASYISTDGHLLMVFSGAPVVLYPSDVEMVNVRTWLSHNEWRSPNVYQGASIPKATQIPE